jgi:3'-phosphoadenosine 5'-phosphosulfate sulfotransferase (PAPS reductase)/FAD synthetase
VIDPFKIDGPTVITVSAGRTSAYLLRRLLDANGGLPRETVVLNCNTGKEEEASIRFIRDIERHWAVPITMLEYRLGGNFEVVNFETASRNGEPYEAVIQQRGGVLPNPRARYCSSEMKTRTMHRYLRSLGWVEWETFLGIRADEPRRAAKFRFNPHPETKDEYVRIPLVDAFVTSHEVGEFWRKQPFDLGLPNMNGKTMHGNCDLCFLKPAHQVFSLIAEKPERAIWWAKEESKAEAVAHGDGCRFRNDRASYAEMAQYAAQQTDMFDPDEEAISCLCGD